MEFIRTEFPGLTCIRPRVFHDSRGFFLESFRARLFAEQGLPEEFVQDNHACSAQAGVVRGLHMQLPPAAQGKLVWVTRGSVFDVALDLRTGSPTYGKAYTAVLSAGNFLRLFIPQGFAHGYMTLEPHTEFQYKVDAYYAPQAEAGIRWDDPDLDIPWPDMEAVLSPKDAELPRLCDFASPFVYVP